jgi:DNA-binding NtrC family response regulator
LGSQFEIFLVSNGIEVDHMLAGESWMWCFWTWTPICNWELHNMTRIGLYSEDRALQPLLSSALGNQFEVFLASNGIEVDHMLAVESCDVVLLDLDSNQKSLNERLECARHIVASQVPAVVMASDALRSTAVELVRMGAYGYCRRPPSIRDLETMLRRAHENASLKRELQSTQRRLDTAGSSCGQMIGSSPQMRQVYDLVHRVANLSASVLVTGESGTGKELIARAIHDIGSRAGRPFVAVSCGAIPETLIEAELFGHEKGAFTGTVGAREGFLGQACDGTLFLDEIGELSLFTQVKLLRVLQQREFSPLGSNRLIPLRARIIFATHQDLDEMVAQGKFRQDLYYRVNVMRIDAPALQEHAEDIPQIAMRLLQHYADLYQKPMEDIEPDAMALLQGYAWPGNVRELENVVQRAIIVANGTRICIEDIPQNIQKDIVAEHHPAGSFECQLRDYKIKLAMTAVRDNDGNKTQAARSLNISRAYLHRLIRTATPFLIAESEHLIEQDLDVERDSPAA